MKVKKEKPNIKSNKGFTLIEVLLAIVILSLVSAPILRGFVVTANTSARARKIMEATDVAQLIVEEVSAMSFSGDVKDTFFENGNKERLPAIGYNYGGEKIDQPAGVIRAQLPSVFVNSVSGSAGDQKKCYYMTTTDSDGFVALPNVEYDGKMYDVAMYFKANSGDGTKYYTYDVTVEVYDQDVSTSVNETDGSITKTYTHYRNLLVTLKTEISNKY